MEHVALQTMLNQPVVWNDPATKAIGVVVAWMAGERRSGAKREKHDRRDGKLQIHAHVCPISISWLAAAPQPGGPDSARDDNRGRALVPALIGESAARLKRSTEDIGGGHIRRVAT